jgi:uncharacterized membrane protein YphA (DoxX/SURF4 family)
MNEESNRGLGRILLIIGRIALAAVFLYAVYGKTKPMTPGAWSVSSMRTSLLMFAMEIDSYQMLPENLVSPTAHAVPAVELLVGLLLLSGLYLRWVGTATTVLLAVLFGVMVRAYALGLEINCGCFGPGERLGPASLLRDGSLLALSLAITIGAFVIDRRQGVAPGPAPAPQHAE